jgi:hypothetical protein
MADDKNKVSTYNRHYFANNKARILAKRKARRATMTDEQREDEPVKARAYTTERRRKLNELFKAAVMLADTVARNSEDGTNGYSR